MLVNGAKDPRFGRVPGIESFAKSETVEALTMYRTLRLVGVPYSLPLRTPKDRVMILQDATRKAFNDAEFHREYKKLTDEDPDPLIPEEMEK